jgi:uncharacterized protein
MTVFADTSALVKLYADEADHEVVRTAADQFVVSELSRVEVPSALWRKHRMAELSSEDAAVLSAEFEYDWYGDPEVPPRFSVIAAGPVLNDAARLVAVHGLRAYDAIQLATANACRTVLPECNTFAAFDRSLRKAAAIEGWSLMPAA